MGRHKKVVVDDDDDEKEIVKTEKVTVRKKKISDRSVNNVQEQDKVGIERLQRIVTATCDKDNIDNLTWTVDNVRYHIGSEIINEE